MWSPSPPPPEKTAPSAPPVKPSTTMRATPPTPSPQQGLCPLRRAGGRPERGRCQQLHLQQADHRPHHPGRVRAHHLHRHLRGRHHRRDSGHPDRGLRQGRRCPPRLPSTRAAPSPAGMLPSPTSAATSPLPLSMTRTASPPLRTSLSPASPISRTKASKTTSPPPATASLPVGWP